jgi:hypothetical protein
MEWVRGSCHPPLVYHHRSICSFIYEKRYGDVDDRAGEKEHDQLERAAFHVPLQIGHLSISRPPGRVGHSDVDDRAEEQEQQQLQYEFAWRAHLIQSWYTPGLTQVAPQERPEEDPDYLGIDGRLIRVSFVRPGVEADEFRSCVLWFIRATQTGFHSFTSALRRLAGSLAAQWQGEV